MCCTIFGSPPVFITVLFELDLSALEYKQNKYLYLCPENMNQRSLFIVCELHVFVVANNICNKI